MRLARVATPHPTPTPYDISNNFTIFAKKRIISYTICLFHIVFGTKHRKRTIYPEYKENLYKYLCGIAENKKCSIETINGVSNHIHILANLHPKTALSDFVGALKQSSSLWMKNYGGFPEFEGWSREYFACSVSQSDKDPLSEYIMNQEEHHRMITFFDEMCEDARRFGFEMYENSFDN